MKNVFISKTKMLAQMISFLRKITSLNLLKAKRKTKKISCNFIIKLKLQNFKEKIFYPFNQISNKKIIINMI